MKKDYNPLTVCLCFLFLNILTCPCLFEHSLLTLIYVHVVQHFKDKFCNLPALFCYSAEVVLCSVAEMCTVPETCILSETCSSVSVAVSVTVSVFALYLPCISLYSSVFVCTALYFSVLLCICSAAAMYLLCFALYLLCSCSVSALLCYINTIS